VTVRQRNNLCRRVYAAGTATTQPFIRFESLWRRCGWGSAQLSFQGSGRGAPPVRKGARRSVRSSYVVGWIPLPRMGSLVARWKHGACYDTTQVALRERLDDELRDTYRWG